MQHRCFARILPKLLIVALKDKKAVTIDMKENLHFKQLQLNYINNHQKQKKDHIELVIVSIGVDVVAKIDDEIYVLSVIKTYCYFSFVLCCTKEGRVFENNENDVATLKILR